MRLKSVLGIRPGRGALSVAVVAAMAAAAAAGQTCPPQVTAGYIDLPRETPPKVWAIEHFDGITRLSGEFTFPGHETANWLAIDDGSGLRPVIRDAGGSIRTLEMASGPETFVYEYDSTVSRWTGAGLEPLGESPGVIHAIEVFDDGAGPMLYVGGWLRIEGVRGNVARWTGEHWEFPGGGLDERSVYALAVFDDGSGSALYAGGRFDRSGEIAETMARWDGDQWSFIDGPRGVVNELEVVELNGRSILVAAGRLSFSPERRETLAATWDGLAWRPVGDPPYSAHFGSGPAGTKTPIRTMTSIVRDDTLMVYVGGDFSIRWRSPEQRASLSAFYDGTQWHTVYPLVEPLDSAPTPDGQGIAVANGEPTSHMLGFPLGGVVTVTPCTCRADLDGDGELTLFDFLAFQTLFTLGHQHADFDGDGELTFFDFLAFQSAFAAGCP